MTVSDLPTAEFPQTAARDAELIRLLCVIHFLGHSDDDRATLCRTLLDIAELSGLRREFQDAKIRLMG